MSHHDEARAKHEAKYEALCKERGVKWNKDSPRLVGETLESLARKFAEDPNLNNVPLRLWDNLASSFMVFGGRGLSLGEAVCAQKYAAKKLLKEEGLIP